MGDVVVVGLQYVMMKYVCMICTEGLRKKKRGATATKLTLRKKNRSVRSTQPHNSRALTSTQPHNSLPFCHCSLSSRALWKVDAGLLSSRLLVRLQWFIASHCTCSLTPFTPFLQLLPSSTVSPPTLHHWAKLRTTLSLIWSLLCLRTSETRHMSKTSKSDVFRRFRPSNFSRLFS